MNTDNYKMLLKKKQHWLLMLRHGSKCNNETCTIDKCQIMKDLWKHIISCKNINCTNKCYFSKCLLSHYAKCKEECDFCVPIRDALKRHNKRIRKDNPQLESCKKIKTIDHSKFSTEEHNCISFLASLRISTEFEKP